MSVASGGHPTDHSAIEVIFQKQFPFFLAWGLQFSLVECLPSNAGNHGFELLHQVKLSVVAHVWNPGT